LKRFLLVLFSVMSAVLLCALPAAADRLFNITTLAAKNVTFTSATLSATFVAPLSNDAGNNNIVNAGVTSAVGFAPNNIYFLYGTSPASLVHQTPTQNVGNAGLVRADIRDLLPGTTYYAEAVATVIFGSDQYPGPEQFLMSLLSPSSSNENLRCAGIGLQALPLAFANQTVTGNMITFTTLISRPPQSSSAGGVPTVVQGPVPISNITVENISLSSAKVGPGAPVTVTAYVANKGTADGSSRIKLYINGQEEANQGVTLSSGSRTPVKFTISRDEPGSYSVYVGSIPAGSFEVDQFADPNLILYISGALLLFALAGGVIFMATRKPR
jgi:hypothetical protein